MKYLERTRKKNKEKKMVEIAIFIYKKIKQNNN